MAETTLEAVLMFFGDLVDGGLDLVEGCVGVFDLGLDGEQKGGGVGVELGLVEAR